MAFWTEVHWSEGMFLRPHHLQASQRWLETVLRTAFDGARPFGWGFLNLQIAQEPLENFTLRLDRCDLRLKDGTWVRVPENTEAAPLNFQAPMDAGRGQIDVYLGIPDMQDVRPNAISVENPAQVVGTPRYEPFPVHRRDENSGDNAQTIYVRRMRGRLFIEGEDMTGYQVVRVGRVKRTDRPGALPELDELGAGPLLALQADPGLSKLISSLSDQVEAKDEILGREVREHNMQFDDDVASNSEMLLKLHVLNEVRTHLKSLLQCPVLHPYDVFTVLARLAGHLSVFHDDRVPVPVPLYDHDRPGEALEQLRARIVILLDAMRPMNYVERKFARVKDARGTDGLQVELDRRWIDDNLDMFVAFHAPEQDITEVERQIRTTFNLKLASPTQAPRIHGTAVRGLEFVIRPVPAGTLPRRQGLHYFKIDKTIGPDRTDYWKLCEQERGIRMSIPAQQISAMERFSPALYVVLKD